MKALITEAKNRKIATSLAVFKPKEIQDFVIESCNRVWSKKKLDSLQQMNIFEKVGTGKPQVVRKLPYKFSYRFIDENDQQATIMIEDWEIGQLYWNCLARHEGDELKACEDVRQKYLVDFARTKDLYLFLGTAQKFQLVAPNPFLIIGTFHPKFPAPTKSESQLKMF